MIQGSDNNRFRNFIDSPYNNCSGRNNFCNSCGLSATGDMATQDEPVPQTTLPAKVRNITAWHYVKTGLAVIGIFVIATYAYKHFKK